MAELIYYLNGEYINAGMAALPLNDLGIVRGYGVFDVLRTYHQTPFKVREHVLRLQKSARSIGINGLWSTAELEEIVHSTLQHNFALTTEVGDVYIRLVMTGGPSLNGFTPQNKPSLFVTVAPIPPKDTALYKSGAKLMTVQMDRFMPTVKTLNYIGAIMAMQQAAETGAVEALYRTEEDRVTECTRCSFFVVKDEQIITPSEAVLDGITRRVILDLASEHFSVHEEPVTYKQLKSVKEAFIVGTGKEVLPIVQIDGIQVGQGHPGVVSKQIMQLFDEYVLSESAALV